MTFAATFLVLVCKTLHDISKSYFLHSFGNNIVSKVGGVGWGEFGLFRVVWVEEDLITLSVLTVI